MRLEDLGVFHNGKLRIVQESVSGKQVSLAHLISRPDTMVYERLGLEPSGDPRQTSIAILNLMPSEASVVAGDVALKTSDIEMGFIDRFSGTLIFTGRTAGVENAMRAILDYLKRIGFAVCRLTRA